MRKKFKTTKGVKSRKTKKDRQCNDQKKKKDKQTNNGGQNTTKLIDFKWIDEKSTHHSVYMSQRHLYYLSFQLTNNYDSDCNWSLSLEEFENTKADMRIRKLKKHRQHKYKKNKDKR